MEKLGVELDDSLKFAEDNRPGICPSCGAELDYMTNVWKCPACGTKPFEQPTT